MPVMRLCAGCGAPYVPPTARRVARCGPCQREWARRDNARRNAKPSKAFYQSAAWRKVSAMVRERDGRCVYCGGPPQTAHHVPPRADLEAAGLDPLDPRHCVAACLSCNGASDGGRGAPARVAGRHLP